MRVLTVCVCLFTLAQTFAQEAWTQLNDFPFETQSRGSFIYQGEAYVVTGEYLDGSDDDIYRYNLENDSWTFITTVPSNYAAPFVINNLIYFLEFDVNDFSVDLWEYDLLNGIWEPKSEVENQYQSQFGNSLPHTYVIENVAYVIFPGDGIGDGIYTAKKYNPSADSWESIAPYASSFFTIVGASFVAQGKAYTVYGFGPENVFNELNVYDPTLDIWEQKANAPLYYLDGPVALPIGNKIYIGGGNIDGPPNPFFHSYNIDLDIWEQVEDPNYSVDYAFSFVLNGAGYFGTGRLQDPDANDVYSDQKKVYRLNPEFLSTTDVEIPSLSLYPNPAKDVVHIKNLPPNASLTVFDILGKEFSVDLGGTNKLDVSKFASGLYFLNVVSPAGKEVLKFIKQE